MAGIWFCFQRVFAPPGVPILDEFGIALERFGRREFLGPEFAPKTSLRIAKSCETALSRNSGTSERDNLPRIPQLFEQLSGKIHSEEDFIEIVSCSKRLIMCGKLSKQTDAISR
jgi:hypothetical protein